MDERPDPPDKPPAKTIECGMCKRRVPVEDTRTFNGRVLCFGCLSSWYDDDDDEEEEKKEK